MTPRARLFAHLTLAYLRRHRARALLTAFGIALGVASFTGVLALNRSTMQAFEESVTRTAGHAQLQVSNGTAGLKWTAVEKIAKLPGVLSASGNLRYTVYVPRLGRRITILAVDIGQDRTYREAQVGRDVLYIPDDLAFIVQPDSVALSEALRAEMRATIGDRIEVLGSHGPTRLAIRGTLHPQGVLQVFGNDLALMDAEGAQRMFHEGNKVHWIDVVAAPGRTGEVEECITRALGGRGIVTSPVNRGRRIEAMLGLLRVLLTGSGIVALLVGIFLIHQAVGTSLRQRRSDLSLLKALGLSRWGLAAYVLGEAALVGVLAALGGVAAGVGFWYLATGPFAETVSTFFAPIPPTRFALSPTEFVTVLLAGVLAAVLGALLPSLAALRLRPVAAAYSGAVAARRSPWPLAVVGALVLALGATCAALARGRPPAWQVAAMGGFGACFFAGTTLLVPAFLSVLSPLVRALMARTWGFLGTWSWKQVQRREADATITIGALAAGVAFALGMMVMLGSYRSAFLDWLNQSFAPDVIVNAGPTVSLLGGPTIDLGVKAEFERMPGVARAMPLRFLEVQFRGQPIIVQGMAEPLLARAHPGVALERPNDVVVSDTLAEHFGLSAGDTITLPAPHGPLSVRIRAVAPDYVLHLGSVKMPWTTFARYFDEERASLFLVDGEPGVRGEELRSRIAQAAAGRYDITVLTRAEMRALIDELVDRSIALSYWLQILAAFVAMCAMVNATAASILDRGADLALWRAQGLTRQRLTRLLVTEAGLVGLLGSALGLVSGSLFGWVLVAVIAPAVGGFRLGVRWPMDGMLELLVVSTLAAAGTAWLVARGWTRRAVAVPV